MPDTVIAHEPPVGRSHWFGLLAGPLVYSLHFMVVYLLVETACRADLLRFTWLGLDGIVIWVVALTLVAALVTGYSMVVALRNWQQARPANGQQHPPRKEGNASLMAQVGIWLSGYFTIAVLLTGLPAAFLSICSWV